MKEKITAWQTVLLLISAVLPTAILTVPVNVVRFARNDAWLSILLATLVGGIGAWIAGSLALRYPGLGLYQIVDKMAGRIAAKAVCLIFLYYFFIGVADILHQYTNFLSVTIVGQTPIVLVGVIALLLAIYVVYSGIEVMARVNQIIIISAFFVFAVSTVFYFKEMEFERLLPVFHNSWSRIALGAMAPAGWLAEVSLVLLLTPHLRKPEQARKAALWAVVLSGGSLAWTIFGSIAVFGSDILPLFNYPTFNVFRLIRLADFIERIDALYIAAWVGAMTMKLSVYTFAGVYSFRYLFGIKDREQGPFLFPYAALALTYSILSWENNQEYLDHTFHTSQSYLLFYNFAVPAVLWLASYGFGRKRRVCP
jgi:spore germination protein KB